LGTWPIAGSDGIPGYGRFDEERGRTVLESAIAAGLTLFDTASVYGAGAAERLLGDVLERMSAPAIVCTKGGWDLERGAFNPDPSFVSRDFERSRQRLRRARVDIYLLHSPPPELIGVRELYRPLVALRRANQVQHIGVSVRALPDAWLTLDRPEVEVVELPFNIALADGSDVLARLAAAGKGVIVREALGNGLLTGKYRIGARFEEGDFRSQWPAGVTDAQKHLRAWAPYRRRTESWVRFALRFVLDRPEVSTVVVGASQPGQLEELTVAAAVAPSASGRPAVGAAMVG
jgi:aryl-alcohol dehydrogenase-like predicted oxidoreductase